jgi:hypothetical protein
MCYVATIQVGTVQHIPQVPRALHQYWVNHMYFGAGALDSFSHHPLMPFHIGVTTN